MQNYTITEAKVKTLYTIQIGPDDLVEIVGRICESAYLRDKLPAYGTELDKISLDAVDNTGSGDILLQRIWSTPCPHANTIGFIAHEVLGFDGVENYGYFNENIDRAVMVVYRRGDRLNDGGPPVPQEHRAVARRRWGGVAADAAHATDEATEPTDTPPAPPKSLTEVIKEAAAAGMSYGQYVQATEPRRAPAPKSEAEPQDPVKSKRTRREYSNEEKKNAVQRAISGDYCTIKEAADDLGIPYPTLLKWVHPD